MQVGYIKRFGKLFLLQLNINAYGRTRLDEVE